MAYSVEPLSPFGALVHGIDLQWAPDVAAREMLQYDAARYGFLVFPNQTLPGDSLAMAASVAFGSGCLAERHTVHSAAVHDGILRLSNEESHGITFVGPQWHSDGAFERRPFSHVLFHPQQMPADGGGGTELTDLSAAYEALPTRLKHEWSRLAITNAYSGALHPLVGTHPVSGKRVLFAHLGMVGAVLRWPEWPKCAVRSWTAVALEAMDASTGPRAECGHELLPEEEVRQLMRAIDGVLTRHGIVWNYRLTRREAGVAADLLVVDNLAVAHRAAPSAHAAGTGELRILHRTTVAGTHALDPPAASRLPPFLYMWGERPMLQLDHGGKGVGVNGLWMGSDHLGVGFRWNVSLPMRN